MNGCSNFLKEIGSRSKSLSREPPPSWILVADSEENEFQQFLAEKFPGCRVVLGICPETAARIFLSSAVDLVLLKHSRRIPCLNLLPLLKLLCFSIPVIVIDGHGTENIAVEAFRNGALDYLDEPLNLEELELIIRGALDMRETLKTAGEPLPVNGLQNALRYIEENFHVPLKLADVAKKAGMSVSCFEKRLRQKTGMSFTTHVNCLRVRQAKKLLQDSGASIFQIALKCGFNSHSDFNRVFRKIAGTTPSRYRKANFRSKTEVEFFPLPRAQARPFAIPCANCRRIHSCPTASWREFHKR